MRTKNIVINPEKCKQKSGRVRELGTESVFVVCQKSKIDLPLNLSI